MGLLFRDITNHKQAARLADAERRRLNAVLEAAPVGITVADADGALLLINPENERIWGKSPVSKTVDEYREWKGWWADGSERHGRRVEPYEWALARALAGEEAPRWIIEIEPFDAPSLRRTVFASAAPIRSEENQIIGGVVTLMDITDRIKAEEALKDAARRKDEFLAVLAHELRNPLAPIGAAAELLQIMKLDEANVRKTSQIIGRQVRHMTSLVDDLVDVSRVTSGLVMLDNEPLDISHVIEDAVEQAMPLVRSRHHRIGLQITPQAPMVLGDKKRLVQVIVNLLNNAAKYTPEGGEIQITAGVDGDDVLVQVIDNGMGMAPELTRSAFDLFTQAERSSDRTSGGPGLGLALVKSLIELHHGTVNVDSPGVGRGSTFIVRLPRLKTENRTISVPDADAREEVSSRSLRIMVVDDNVDAAFMLAMLLEASGHVVLVEHGSRRALERARKESPEVCLLDIGLPEIDGNELAKRLRAQPETANAVLIAITGYGQERDQRQTLAAGFDHHLVKPVDTAALNAILSAIFTRDNQPI